MSARRPRSADTRCPMPSRPPELSSAVGMRIRSPRRGIPLRDHRPGRRHHGGQARLHVAHAPAVDPAVLDLAAQRVLRPALPDRPDVEVPVHDQGPPAARAAEPGDQARPGGHRLVELRLEAERGEVLVEHARGRLLVARRVLGVDAEETLQERNRLVLVDAPVTVVIGRVSCVGGRRRLGEHREGAERRPGAADELQGEGARRTPRGPRGGRDWSGPGAEGFPRARGSCARG